MNRKIYWLPAWYPTAQNPLGGIFFKEQAEHLSTAYDIHILYLQVKPMGKKEYIKKLGRPQIKEISLAGKLPGIGLELKLPAFVSGKRWLKMLFSAYGQLFKLALRQFGIPALLHAHGGLYAGISSAYLKQHYGVPNLITEHHPIIISDFTATTAREYSRALNTATAVSTVSQYAKRMLMLQAQRCSPVVHGNLVNEDQLSIQNAKPARFHVGWIGYPSYNKDPFTFIQAIRILHSNGRFDFQASMVMPEVGGDFRHSHIQEVIGKAGLADVIELKTGMPKEKLQQYYHSLSVLVSTSYSETFGLVMAEAAACGIPVIATKSGGAEEVVSPEVGYLVDIQDSAAIASCLAQLQQEEKQWKPLGLRQAVVSRFGKDAFLHKIDGLYFSLINNA